MFQAKLIRNTESSATRYRPAVVMAILVLLAGLGGCESEDCLNCVDLPLPVVPTGVHSISGDNEVIVQWYDISYAPYDGSYNENVTKYIIYSRYYQVGDENDPSREFEPWGEVAWDENYDPTTGLHWFVDNAAINGEEYEYAVTAVNAAGGESALSYEFVTDAPLPMSPWSSVGYIPVTMSDGNGANRSLSGFIFSKAAGDRQLNAGRVDPDAFEEDVLISFTDGVPYVQAAGPRVQIQDFGVFSSDNGLIFEGVSWAPYDGYSRTGRLELVSGHIYVLQIGLSGQDYYYAKMGVTGIGTDTVDIIWAYQTIANLPELSNPEGGAGADIQPVVLKL